MQLLGVDTGGTFTDSVIILADGSLGVGKVLSTTGALERGVLASIEAAAADVHRTVADVLATTDFVAHGTTAGLNALLTGNGARVGLLTTQGFEATDWIIHLPASLRKEFVYRPKLRTTSRSNFAGPISAM
jgi:N-methylhydantoinase A